MEDSSQVSKDYSCAAEDLVDAKLTTKSETLLIIERLTEEFLQMVASGNDPELFLVCSHQFYYYYSVMMCE